MAKSNKAPQIVRSITSLGDFQASTFTAVITVGDEQWEVPCKELTQADLAAIDDEIIDPLPPEFAGPSGKVFITNDPTYLKAKDKANHERLLLRLAEMLQIEDKTRAEKRDALNTAASAFVNGLASVFTQTQFAKEARIEAKSHSFRGAGSSNGAHSESDELDTGVLALATGE